MQEHQKNQENADEIMDIPENTALETGENDFTKDDTVVGVDGDFEEDNAKAGVKTFEAAANSIACIIDRREKLVAVLFWLFALSGVIISFQNGTRGGADVAGGIVITVLCIMLYTFYIDISEFSGENLFFLLCSGLFLGLSSVFNAQLFWIIFAVTVAVTSGIKLGMASFLLLFLEYLICIPTVEVDKNRVMAVFLMGIAFICLFSYIKEQKEEMPVRNVLPMTGGIILCQSIVFYFVWAHFSIREITESGLNFFMWIFGAVFLYSVGIIVWYMHGRKHSDSGVSEEILSPEYELCSRMREYSEPLYRHSMRVSELAGGACGELGGDVFLVRAAGLYHEVGRIRDEDVYIEEGLELGKAYGFPERLLDVISQHSTAFEKPQSVEAAVLMLTDCVVSTNEYLEKTGKRSGITDDKLVSVIFKNRIDKGNLSESGITDEQLDTLKQYFTEHMEDIRNSLMED